MRSSADGGDKGKVERLRDWEWLSTWAVVVEPSDRRTLMVDYILPELIMHEHIINIDSNNDDQPFVLPALVGLNEQRAAKHEARSLGLMPYLDLVNNSDDAWMVWCHLNDESEMLGMAIDSVTCKDQTQLTAKRIV